MRGATRAGAATMRRWLPAWALSFLLAACGGGGGSGGPGPSSGLPTALAVSAPSAQQPLGEAVAFSANASNSDFSYHWDFGDGGTSTEVAPTHLYSRPGVFTVRLTVGNSGRSVSATGSVAIADFAIVAGKSCNQPGGNGWCWQRPLPQGNFIHDYAFVDDRRGWAVGQAGTILATSDGGVTWTGQVSGTTLDIGHAVFPSATAGWLASEFGELLRTADGGASWRRVSFGRNDFILDIGASDADTAWVRATTGVSLVTRDAGSSWRQLEPAPGGTYRFAFASANDVWSLPPSVHAQPTLARSVDGGSTWTTVTLPPIPADWFGYSEEMLLVDPLHALVIGYESGNLVPGDGSTFATRRTLYLTADGGASWQQVQPPASGASFGYRLADPTTVLAVGANLVLRTQDNGASWPAVPLPPGVLNVIDVRAFSAQRYALIDGNGRSWLSTDGGTSWNLRNAGGVAQATINSVWFFDSREGLAIADDGTSVRTSDGGRTWIAAETDTASWFRMQFLPDGGVGWLISLRGTIDRTIDKGRSWTPPSGASDSLLGVTDFHFVDALHGWAVAPVGIGLGTVFTTSDGGVVWKAVPSTANSRGFSAIRFADPMRGVIVGPSGVAMVTGDGGATWRPRPTGAFGLVFAVTFADASTAVAVGEGGLVIRSTDAGQSWQPMPRATTRNLYAVRFVTPLIGHAVGDQGTFVATRDGGLTWTAVPTGTKAGFGALFFRDEQTGWIAGTGGSILATATGGR